jgi:hypothetical protein
LVVGGCRVVVGGSVTCIALQVRIWEVRDEAPARVHGCRLLLLLPLLRLPAALPVLPQRQAARSDRVLRHHVRVVV